MPIVIRHQPAFPVLGGVAYGAGAGETSLALYQQALRDEAAFRAEQAATQRLRMSLDAQRFSEDRQTRSREEMNRVGVEADWARQQAANEQQRWLAEQEAGSRYGLGAQEIAGRIALADQAAWNQAQRDQFMATEDRAGRERDWAWKAGLAREEMGSRYALQGLSQQFQGALAEFEAGNQAGRDTRLAGFEADRDARMAEIQAERDRRVAALEAEAQAAGREVSPRDMFEADQRARLQAESLNAAGAITPRDEMQARERRGLAELGHAQDLERLGFGAEIQDRAGARDFEQRRTLQRDAQEYQIGRDWFQVQADQAERARQYEQQREMARFDADVRRGLLDQEQSFVARWREATVGESARATKERLVSEGLRSGDLAYSKEAKEKRRIAEARLSQVRTDRTLTPDAKGEAIRQLQDELDDILMNPDIVPQDERPMTKEQDFEANTVVDETGGRWSRDPKSGKWNPPRNVAQGKAEEAYPFVNKIVDTRMRILQGLEAFKLKKVPGTGTLGFGGRTPNSEEIEEERKRLSDELGLTELLQDKRRWEMIQAERRKSERRAGGEPRSTPGAASTRSAPAEAPANENPVIRAIEAARSGDKAAQRALDRRKIPWQ